MKTLFKNSATEGAEENWIEKVEFNFDPSPYIENGQKCFIKAGWYDKSSWDKAVEDDGDQYWLSFEECLGECGVYSMEDAQSVASSQPDVIRLKGSVATESSAVEDSSENIERYIIDMEDILTAVHQKWKSGNMSIGEEIRTANMLRRAFNLLDSI